MTSQRVIKTTRRSILLSLALYLLDGVSSAPLLHASRLHLKARTPTEFAGGTEDVLMSRAAAIFDKQSHTTDNG
jgi:hypothetical protein